ncbi:uncharacterized protein Triagg1_11 [Trichoderma aggressivum f. europaeum]|uniref:Clr5 domain-containing protein n=1 Tax=Trichoderma aggressivum f. europaeum TaxID=173218 RepID=A0AAE1IKQ5_9HYPO|nr:hypothetical protein Triagg1_11 [Trichoderma aggressivum f. europaeum]
MDNYAMTGQYSHHSSNNDHESNNIVLQTSGDMGLFLTPSLAEDDIIMSPANGQHQYPISGNEPLAPNNWAPPPHPAHQAEMAGSLNEVDGLFDNQPAGDAAYASPDVLSTAVDGAQDTPSHVLANTPATANGQPPGQRRSRARPLDPQLWEHHKANIYSYYIEQDCALSATMDLMQANYQFQATEKMYKYRFKKWKWSKNPPRVIAASMLDIAEQRQPVERIKKLQSRHSAEDSFIQEGSSIHDEFTYRTPTPPSSGVIVTAAESVFENLQGTDGDLDMAGAATADTCTQDLRKFLDEGFCRTNATPEELYSRVQEAVKAIGEGTCNHEEAGSAFRAAFSYYRHHWSPTHSKTLEIGYFLATFYVKTGRVNDAHCILDWMTKEHCDDTKSCHAGTITHLISTIGILRQTRRDKEANMLTIQLLKHHQAPEAGHFLLQSPSDPSGPCAGSNEMIEDLIASSEPEKLAAMSTILERLSTDSKNHQLLQDLLPRYVQKCDGQPTLENQAIHSGCILAAALVTSAQYARAINTLKEAERLLNPFLNGNNESQCPLEPSTLTLARRLAFTYADANDPNACLRVLSTTLEHIVFDELMDVGTGYGLAVCDFLMSTASELHEKGFCKRSGGWMNQALLKSQTIFGDDHECTKRIQEVMTTCDMDIYFGGPPGTC